MGRTINKLSVKNIDALKGKKADPVNGKRRVSDGGNLWMNVSDSGSKSWIFRWTPKGGIPRELGLGAYPNLSLADARRVAETNRNLVANSIDPKRVRDEARITPLTFGQVADTYLDTMEARWTNDKTRWQWRDSLIKRCSAVRNRPINEFETEDVLAVLKPIWLQIPETARRIRMRMESVLSYAKAQKLRAGDNPAMWRGHLDQILPKHDPTKKRHHAAMPYKEVPTFIARIQSAEALAARALELCILTSTRTSEVLKANWLEIDLAEAVWTIPPERMKARREHRIPLAPRSIVILSQLREVQSSDLIFPGQAHNKPLSNMAMEMLLRRLKVEDATVHGFRSSFRDWVLEETNFPGEIAEMALSHKVGGAVELAYKRGDGFNKRRILADAWASYCSSEPLAKVVQLHGNL